MPDTSVERAHRFLRAHTTADLRFDEHVRPVRYVIEPAGAMVFPCMVAMLHASETVLFIPREEDDSMEMLVTLEAFDEHGEDGAHADRWRIYHGEPQDVRWARVAVEAARFEGYVLDGEVLAVPNPLAADEPALCREMNADRARLRAICAACGRDAEQPVLVGVDAAGLDVRRRFDVVRVTFPRIAESADDVRTLVGELSTA